LAGLLNDRVHCRDPVTIHDSNRIDDALEGLRGYLEKDGEPDSSALDLVIAGLSKAGRLKDASELLLEAINARWIGMVPLEKTTAILAGMSMKCAKEDDYAREFVEVMEPSFTDKYNLLQSSLNRALRLSPISAKRTKRLLGTIIDDWQLGRFVVSCACLDTSEHLPKIDATIVRY
jgi:hypothetical protein